MPVEVALWALEENAVRTVEPVRMDREARLQDVLANDLDVVEPGLMLLGREVPTDWGSRIDLLAMRADGHLVVIELKRDRTPREIVAQILEYGAWVRSLRGADIVQVFDRYGRREGDTRSLDEVFHARFGIDLPEELNDEHELLIVASELDPGTERIVNYLAEEYDAHLNAVFFRVFKDRDREYLARAWLRDPTLQQVEERDERRVRGDWNGEFYVSFGVDEHRSWDDARKYGFVSAGGASAGGGDWYRRTLKLLQPGARVWVKVPKSGYVGVGEVKAGPQPLEAFTVRNGGHDARLLDAPHAAKYMTEAEYPGGGEHLVRVEWLHTVPLEEAVHERGLFGNQNIVAQPRAAEWGHTIQRLRQVWGL